MLEAFREGGWGMIPTLFVGLMTIAASVMYARSPERRYVPLQISLGITTLACGSLSFVTGLIKSVSSIGGVEADKRWIWLLGMGESLNGIGLALGLATLAGLIASVGAFKVARVQHA